MEIKEKQTENDDASLHKITPEEFEEFTQAQSYEEQLRILLAHAEKNKKRIAIKRAKQEGRMKTQEEIEKEILELNRQFSEFLHTKGIKARFELAFSNMGESARRQHEIDKANFEAEKAKAIEENKDFVEFLHAKGFKAKYRVVIENIKKGVREAPARTAAQIAKAQAESQASIYGQPHHSPSQVITAEMIVDEFNAFLKAKGLDTQYTVVISDE